jgi:hypothetical protein
MLKMARIQRCALLGRCARPLDVTRRNPDDLIEISTSGTTAAATFLSIQQLLKELLKLLFQLSNILFRPARTVRADSGLLSLGRTYYAS